MASTNTIFKKILGVKHIIVSDVDFLTDPSGLNRLLIHVKPYKRQMHKCPICHKRCKPYDVQSPELRGWRGLDWGGTEVELVSQTHRVLCPKDGVHVAEVPWAYPGSRFTKEFDLMTAWLAKNLSKSATSELMRIDWKTVGRCVSRAVNEIEPDRSKRLDGLVNIGIDETSYRKGHKYITVVINHDTNTVVWAAPGHGKSVLEQFFRQLSPEQRASIRTVTGDGARWITDCVNEFIPDCERCIDLFHVVEWTTTALDEVRRETWRKAHAEAEQLAKENPCGKGRPKSDDKNAAKVAAARARVKEIKNSTYALGKAPEHLTENQQTKLELIANSNKHLYRA